MKMWAAVSVFWLVPALALGQSLGEAARKEKERRKKNQEAGVKVRTITDQQVNTESEDQASPPSTPAASSPPRTSTSSSSTAGRPAQSEQEWRFRFSQARSRKQKADERYNFLNNLSLVNGEYYVDESGKAVIASLDQLRNMISAAKREADTAGKALRDLEEEARRAGVPPGWTR